MKHFLYLIEVKGKTEILESDFWIIEYVIYYTEGEKNH